MAPKVDKLADARRLGGLRRRREVAVSGAYEFAGLETVADIRRIVAIKNRNLEAGTKLIAKFKKEEYRADVIAGESCAFRKEDGRMCQAAPLKEGAHCFWHSPENAEEVGALVVGTRGKGKLQSEACLEGGVFPLSAMGSLGRRRRHQPMGWCFFAASTAAAVSWSKGYGICISALIRFHLNCQSNACSFSKAGTKS